MADRKTNATKASVNDFIETIENITRRKDSKVVVKIMRKVSGKRATMWGPSIIGFDKSVYQLANGKEGEICKIGFAPRKQSLAFYLSYFEGKEQLLEKLGKYKTSGENDRGCLYITKLENVDLEVLEEIIERAYNKAED